MIEIGWLVGVPLALIGVTLWQPSLVTAVPAFLGIYTTFIVGLFIAPVTTVTLVWLTFSIAIVPFLFYKFPGQYDFRRSLSSLLIWPALAVICAIAERQVTKIVAHDDVPPRFAATVGFIDSTGLEGDFLIVFFDEFRDTAFYCAGELESVHGLAESQRFVCTVSRRSLEEMGEYVLWIEAIEAASDANG